MRPARLWLLIACASAMLATTAAFALAAAPAHRRAASRPHCTTRRHARHGATLSRGRGLAAVLAARRCPAPRRRTARPAPHQGVSTTGPTGTTVPSLTAPAPSPSPSVTAPAPPSPVEETLHTAPPTVTHVQVTAVEYHFTLSRTAVPAGKVDFDFVNAGQDEHNLNVLSGEGSLAGSFPNAASQSVHDQTLEMRRGTYTLFCSLPEHEAKGMHATLTVE